MTSQSPMYKMIYKLKIDKVYGITLMNFAKYKLVMFLKAKLMEMERTDRNRVALYLFNNIIE